MADARAARDLIEEKHIGGLGELDGCLCTNFEVKGVHVDISCRKSDGAGPAGFFGNLVRVWSTHMDVTPEDLALVARPVLEQVRDQTPSTPRAIRFCTWEQDRKLKCVYCGKPRPSYAGYLCEECLGKTDALGNNVARFHDFRAVELAMADLLEVREDAD